MASRYLQTKLWFIRIMLIGITKMILANQTLGLKVRGLSSTTESIQATTAEYSEKLIRAHHHPFMKLIYNEIVDNKHKKWKNGALIKGIEPIKVKQQKRGTARMGFNMRKSYDFSKVWQSVLVLPIRCAVKDCVYPKNFKMLLQADGKFLCDETLISYSHHSYNLLDLTSCFHRWPRTRRSRLENTFNVTLFWKESSNIHIGDPLLVLYFNTSGLGTHKYEAFISNSKHLGRVRRSANISSLKMHNGFARGKVKLGKTEQCVLHEWHVTLEDLHWASWVIAPSEITLNYCSGSCQAPFTAIFNNSSNNASIRSMMLTKYTWMSSVGIPEPQCVPVGLRHTDFMYLDGDEIIIEKLQNVVAENCGCL